MAVNRGTFRSLHYTVAKSFFYLFSIDIMQSTCLFLYENLSVLYAIHIIVNYVDKLLK